jgi:excisionase family DNA binding protein
MDTKQQHPHNITYRPDATRTHVMVDGQECLTVAEAARQIGVTPQAVYNWIHHGSLAAYRVFDRAYVIETEVVAYAKTRRKTKPRIGGK